MTDIGGDCFINIMRNFKPPMNNPRLGQKQQEEEDKLKIELKVSCDHWKYWKSQIHRENWNMPCHLNEILRRLGFVFLLPSSFKR